MENNETVHVMIDLPALPAGFEYTGEYRKALKGECWRSATDGLIITSVGMPVSKQHIVRRTVWHPQVGDTVYVLSVCGKPLEMVFKGSVLHMMTFDSGLMFKDVETADCASEAILALVHHADVNNRGDS